MSTVLIVDTESFFAQSYTLLLSEIGVEVRHAHDVDKALRLLEEGGISAVLTEHKPDALDCFSIIAAARTRKIPVIVCTELTDRQIISECLDEGACEYYIKSHTLPEEIAYKIKKLIS